MVQSAAPYQAMTHFQSPVSNVGEALIALQGSLATFRKPTDHWYWLAMLQVERSDSAVSRAPSLPSESRSSHLSGKKHCLERGMRPKPVTKACYENRQPILLSRCNHMN